MGKNTETKVPAIVENYNLPAMSNEMGAAIAEEMDGLTLSFPNVKIPSGGGLAFEIPGDDPDRPDMAQEIIGVIVDHHPINGFWRDKYSGGNTPPDCSSMDGKTGTDGTWCKDCMNNQWGSDAEGRGKACKNMHRVYILREGEALPLLLTLPPTSLKNLSDYLGLRIVTKGLRSYGVITKISLKKVQNAGGIGYSQAVFAMAGKLSAEQTESMAEYSQDIKMLTRQMTVDRDEYAQNYDDGNDEEVF